MHITQRRISILFAILLLLSSSFLSGCSFLGYTSGYLYDSAKADKEVVKETKAFHPNQDILIQWNDGLKSSGRILATDKTDSLNVVYYSRGYRINMSLNKLLKSNNFSKIEIIEKDTTGRKFGTVLGIIVDLTLIYFVVSFQNFSAPGN